MRDAEQGHEQRRERGARDAERHQPRDQRFGGPASVTDLFHRSPAFGLGERRDLLDRLKTARVAVQPHAQRRGERIPRQRVQHAREVRVRGQLLGRFGGRHGSHISDVGPPAQRLRERFDLA